MDVVVIGGGLGGLASAARLAKLGHQVTLLEASDGVGGALRPVRQDGFTWDAGPTSTLLPATLRDLFRKSGKPLEAELGEELIPLEVIREHRFEDLTSVSLPGGSRALQAQAWDAVAPGLGERWNRHVDRYEPLWEILRREYVEKPWDPATKGAVPRDLAKAFGLRDTLYRLLRADFRDERQALVAGYPITMQGQELRNVPAWVGVSLYLEQCFGGWQVPGGFARLVELLEKRLATRRVTVVTGSTVQDLVVREGRVAAVATAEGEHRADAVVVAVDPRRLPTLAAYVERTMPAIPPVICHVGIEGDVDLPAETVLHADPMFAVRRGVGAPDGMTALSIHARGKVAEDLLDGLARHKIDLREQVVTRIDLSPRELVQQWGGSPLGVLWQGRRTVYDKLGPATPIPGVYVAGAHGAPGAGVPFVAQSAALVAQLIGG
ncbi:phytoene desaturase family protein [Nocardioides montaniterrae]